jgi:hypothetical protein
MRRLSSVLVLAAVAAGVVVSMAGSATAASGGSGLRIRTVPEVAGVRIQVDDRIVTTDAHGRASIDGLTPGTHRLRLLDTRVRGDGTLLEFERWGDEKFSTDRPVTIPTDGSERIELGFGVSYLVSRSFVDQQGLPVPASKISSIVMSSSAGGRFRAHAEEPIWVKGARIIRTYSGLELTDITYSVTSVTVDGTNVVNRGQQRFLASAHANWSISTLFYDATFTVRDRLFGFSIGSSLLLRFPDGRVKTYSLRDGSVTLHDLPRGSYTVTVKGPGVRLSTPVAITRTADSHLVFLSYLDVLAILLVVLGSAVGLIVIGRQRLSLMRALEERRHAIASELVVVPRAESSGPTEAPVVAEAPVVVDVVPTPAKASRRRPPRSHAGSPPGGTAVEGASHTESADSRGADGVVSDVRPTTAKNAAHTRPPARRRQTPGTPTPRTAPIPAPAEVAEDAAGESSLAGADEHSLAGREAGSAVAPHDPQPESKKPRPRRKRSTPPGTTRGTGADPGPAVKPPPSASAPDPVAPAVVEGPTETSSSEHEATPVSARKRTAARPTRTRSTASKSTARKSTATKKTTTRRATVEKTDEPDREGAEQQANGNLPREAVTSNGHASANGNTGAPSDQEAGASLQHGPDGGGGDDADRTATSTTGEGT